MAKAKKSAVKKGKYFQIFSLATQAMRIKPVGTGRHGNCLQPHCLGIAGQHPSLPAYEAEV